MTSKALVLVEGHGETHAMGNLLARLSADIEFHLPWANVLRWTNLHQWKSQRRGGIQSGIEFARSKSDLGALLIVRDEDDGCPAEIAPRIAAKIRELNVAFPIAFVLLKPEYEVLFLPCLDDMESNGFPADLKWNHGTWEAKRDVKGWLSQHLPPGRSYKPTVDQLPMTQKICFSKLREAGVPSFGSLERGLMFLRDHLGRAGAAYPPVP